jgi:hypothetical protein
VRAGAFCFAYSLPFLARTRSTEPRGSLLLPPHSFHGRLPLFSPTCKAPPLPFWAFRACRGLRGPTQTLQRINLQSVIYFYGKKLYRPYDWTHVSLNKHIYVADPLSERERSVRSSLCCVASLGTERVVGLVHCSADLPKPKDNLLLLYFS